MAQPTNLYDTYDTTGIREDLVDVIYNISPEDTPILSAIPRAIAKQTKHEWQIDSLAAAASNAVIEGDDATIDAATATARKQNFTQIMDKVIAVSGTQSSVDAAGRADEMAYQIAKKSKELKKDMELALSSATLAAVGLQLLLELLVDYNVGLKLMDLLELLEHYQLVMVLMLLVQEQIEQ